MKALQKTFSSAKAEAVFTAAMSTGQGSAAGELLFPHFLEAIVHLGFGLANPGFTRERHMATAALAEKGGGGGGGGGGKVPAQVALVPVQVALATLLETHLAPRAQQAAAALARQSEVGALEVSAVLAES